MHRVFSLTGLFCLAASTAIAQDPVKVATAQAEAELQTRLHQSDSRLSRAIEDALARIKRGTFGGV